jgi:DNA-binding CsgD family transcriptional regulator
MKEFGLSIREAEVAAAMMSSLSGKEVAAKLFVTDKTIKFHTTNIYLKIGVHSRIAMVWKFIDIFRGYEADEKPIHVEPPPPAQLELEEILPGKIKWKST